MAKRIDEETGMSHITEEELKALQESRLPRGAPFAICGVSQTQFSVARYYGGCTYIGQFYAYIQNTDELICDDVMKWLKKYRKDKEKKRKTEKEVKQKSIW